MKSKINKNRSIRNSKKRSKRVDIKRSKRISKRVDKKRNKSKKRSRRNKNNKRSRRDGVKKSLLLYPLLATSALSSRPCENYSFPLENAIDSEDKICLDNLFKSCKPYYSPGGDLYQDAIKANDLNCISTLSVVDTSDRSFNPLTYISRNGSLDAFKIFLNKGSYIDKFDKDMIINNVLKRGDIEFLEYILNELGYKPIIYNVWDAVKQITDPEKKFDAYIILLKKEFSVSSYTILKDISINLADYLRKNTDKMYQLLHFLQKNGIDLKNLTYYLLDSINDYKNDIENLKKQIDEINKSKDDFSTKLDNITKENNKLIEANNIYYNISIFISTFLALFFTYYKLRREDDIFSILKIDKENNLIMNNILFLVLSTCNYDNILKYIDKVELNSLDSNRNNVLHYILSHCNIKNVFKIVELLIKKRPQLVNEINNQGDTPLHLLYKKNLDTSDIDELLKIKYILINNGADRNIRNIEDKTPEEYLTIECTICLDKLTNNESKTNCGHIFHKDCIRDHRIINCPICRKYITEIKDYS